MTYLAESNALEPDCFSIIDVEPQWTAIYNRIQDHFVQFLFDENDRSSTELNYINNNDRLTDNLKSAIEKCYSKRTQNQTTCDQIIISNIYL